MHKLLLSTTVRRGLGWPPRRSFAVFAPAGYRVTPSPPRLDTRVHRWSGRIAILLTVRHRPLPLRWASRPIRPACWRTRCSAAFSTALSWPRCSAWSSVTKCRVGTARARRRRRVADGARRPRHVAVASEGVAHDGRPPRRGKARWSRYNARRHRAGPRPRRPVRGYGHPDPARRDADGGSPPDEAARDSSSWPPSSPRTARCRPARSRPAWPPGSSAGWPGTLSRSASSSRSATAWSRSCAARYGARSPRADRPASCPAAALTWVDQIVPGTFERLVIGTAAGQPVRANPLSGLRAGVLPARLRADPDRERVGSGPAVARPRAPRCGTCRGRARLGVRGSVLVRA